jgi:hypothetical protein
MENKEIKWHSRPSVLISIWVLLGIITGVKQYLISDVHSHVNNFVIFKSSSEHFFNHLPLYLEYPKEYFDLYLYGPIFAILMAPFSWMPLGLSVVIWNLANSAILYFAIQNLPIRIDQRASILWIILNSAITALLNTQFHGMCISMILWSYIYVQRGRDFWAACLIMLGILIKFYGIVGLAFFFFSKTRLQFFYYLLAWLVIWGMIPLISGGFHYGIQTYFDWIGILTHKNELNVNIDNIRTDVCVMGMFRRILGNASLSNLWFLIPSMLLNFWVYFQPSKWDRIDFQLRILAFVTIYLMLASTGTESPTLIMAFPGVGLWFVLGPKNKFRWALLVGTLFISSFSPTDLFPRFIRENLINPYALMILPLLIVWCVLACDLWVGQQDSGEVKL